MNFLKELENDFSLLELYQNSKYDTWYTKRLIVYGTQFKKKQQQQQHLNALKNQ